MKTPSLAVFVIRAAVIGYPLAHSSSRITRLPTKCSLLSSSTNVTWISVFWSDVVGLADMLLGQNGCLKALVRTRKLHNKEAKKAEAKSKLEEKGDKPEQKQRKAEKRRKQEELRGVLAWFASSFSSSVPEKFKPRVLRRQRPDNTPAVPTQPPPMAVGVFIKDIALMIYPPMVILACWKLYLSWWAATILPIMTVRGCVVSVSDSCVW